ncbi:hypothetical protein [Sinomonas sp. G460-2]|uniref:hypothetical protein n=1 Tax=Sinomonas sp. G460-2 TaxID=3393464 RepID=UPI0039F0865D
MVAFPTGWIGLIAPIITGALPLFITATIIAGAGQGIAISAATRGLLHGSTLADRAPIFAVIYLLSYSGATIPSLISAQLTNVFSLPQITLGYLGLAVAATVFIAVSARNPRTSTINDIQQNDLGTGGENPSR